MLLKKKINLLILKRNYRYDSDGYLIGGEAFNGEDWNSNSLYNEDNNYDYE